MVEGHHSQSPQKKAAKTWTAGFKPECHKNSWPLPSLLHSQLSSLPAGQDSRCLSLGAGGLRFPSRSPKIGPAPRISLPCPLTTPHLKKGLSTARKVEGRMLKYTDIFTCHFHSLLAYLVLKLPCWIRPRAPLFCSQCSVPSEAQKLAVEVTIFPHQLLSTVGIQVHCFCTQRLHSVLVANENNVMLAIISKGPPI